MGVMKRLVTIALGIVAAACSSSEDAAPATDSGPAVPDVPAALADAAADAKTTGPTTFPGDDATWPTVDPTSAGWDEAKLRAAVEFAGSRASRALVILLDGKILAEAYWTATSTSTRDVASVQKTVMSALVGIAIEKKLVALDETVTTILGAGWSNASASDEAKITLRHLLSMTSGLDATLARVAEPGAAWSYNTEAYHRVQLILEKRSGMSIGALSEQWLFAPIGATHATWQLRPSAPDPKGAPVYGLTLTARDLARIGLLFMGGGKWGASTVVPTAHVAEAIAASQALNPAYGFLVWRNGTSFHLLPPASARTEGPLVPAAPMDLYAGLGKDDQKMYVVPSQRLVVTRLGGQAGSRGADALSDFDNELWAKIEAARTR
jgi:CubicO group peptidase (beta-lactamase class C family)